MIFACRFANILYCGNFDVSTDRIRCILTVKITSDSTCDLSGELLEKYGIDVVPLTVTLGDFSGHDGTDVTPETIYEFVDRSGQLPKSSAVSVGEYKKVFSSLREQGFEVVHINIGQQFSVCWQNACIAAEEVGGVWVVDSENLSTGQGLVVLRAAELAREGISAEEIAQTCQSMTKQVEASFVVNTIDYLYKGGRCSAVAAIGASLLHIKPSIEVTDGKMRPVKKYHGSIHHAIMTYVDDRLKERSDIDPQRIFITHTKVDAQTIEDVKTRIRQTQPEIREIIETTAGATITTHCGPGTLGVLFVRKG